MLVLEANVDKRTTPGKCLHAEIKVGRVYVVARGQFSVLTIELVLTTIDGRAVVVIEGH